MLLPMMQFSDFVDINPRTTLRKGNSYPFIDMASVLPGKRYVRAESERTFSGGGAKFQANDTLFARITPCLENGKIAQYYDRDGQYAFGSTEFFVFRAKKNISDSAFIYYLATTDILRKPAEKSMSGASGRQRADIQSILDLPVPAPPIPIQRKIAAILSAYDDLIENNERRIKILEEMAQNLYREWFVKFRFPGHEKVKMMDSPLGKIPEGWEVAKLGDKMDLLYGKALKEEERSGGDVPVFGSSGIVGYHNKPLVTAPCIIMGRKGNVGSVYLSFIGCWPIDTVFYVATKLNIYYTYFVLRHHTFLNNDAAVPGLNRNAALAKYFIVPSKPALSEFDKLIDPFFITCVLLRQQNNNLRQSRNLLLPRLISGEVDVAKLDIKIPEEINAA